MPKRQRKSRIGFYKVPPFRLSNHTTQRLTSRTPWNKSVYAISAEKQRLIFREEKNERRFKKCQLRNSSAIRKRTSANAPAPSALGFGRSFRFLSSAIGACACLRREAAPLVITSTRQSANRSFRRKNGSNHTKKKRCLS